VTKVRDIQVLEEAASTNLTDEVSGLITISVRTTRVHHSQPPPKTFIFNAKLTLKHWPYPYYLLYP